MLDALNLWWTGLGNAYSDGLAAVLQHVVLPLISWIDMARYAEEAYSATEWFFVGCMELLIVLIVIAPLQRWRPVETVTDKKAVRTDVFYTLIHRLGLFQLALFFLLDPLFSQIDGELRYAGFIHTDLEAWWPGFSTLPLLSFLCYLVIFDFLDYWYHRASHRFHWWWQLHALHHSQRQMTVRSDNRNHLLDDLGRGVMFSTLALAIGVEPSQFVFLVAVGQLLQSLQHANLRLSFGALGERLLVSPRFHRLHHAVGLGHEGARREVLGGCNFGVIFPWWDMLFGTANFSAAYHPTGVRDQLPPPEGEGRDYGRGFLAQQWLGLKRLAGRA